VWINPDRTAVQSVKRIAILAGARGTSQESGVIPLLKILEETIRSSGFVDVWSHRGVLLTLQDDHVNVPIPQTAGVSSEFWANAAGAMANRASAPERVWHKELDSALADSLSKLLQVQAVCIVWLPTTGPETGDLLVAQVFSTPQGRALGGLSTSGPTIHGRVKYEPLATNVYSQEHNFRAIAREVVPFLKQALGAP